MPDPNEFTLAYYATDDGIWINCPASDCDWSKNLRFWPTVAEAVEAARSHVCATK